MENPSLPKSPVAGAKSEDDLEDIDSRMIIEDIDSRMITAQSVKRRASPDDLKDFSDYKKRRAPPDDLKDFSDYKKMVALLDNRVNFSVYKKKRAPLDDLNMENPSLTKSTVTTAKSEDDLEDIDSRMIIEDIDIPDEHLSAFSVYKKNKAPPDDLKDFQASLDDLVNFSVNKKKRAPLDDLKDFISYASKTLKENIRPATPLTFSSDFWDSTPEGLEHFKKIIEDAIQGTFDECLTKVGKHL